MRTKEELNSIELNDDMSELEAELKSRGIEYEIKRHLGADPKLIDLIGYYPTGQWHVKIGGFSIIRGMASFGDFEVYGGKYTEPHRFQTAKELIDDLGLCDMCKGSGMIDDVSIIQDDGTGFNRVEESIGKIPCPNCQ